MLIKAYGFKNWADARTLDAVQRINTRAYPKSYEFALQQLNHMVIVEELFKSRLLGESPPHSSTNTEMLPDLKTLASRLRASTDWYLDYLTESMDLDKTVAFVFADGLKGSMTVEEILFHVITHGSYHRGNIARALDLADVPHPVDGYGTYIHEVEPARREISG